MKKILCVAITLFLLCSQPVWADIHILTINDFHGWVEENGSSPGMAKLAAFIKDYRLTHSDTIVVSGGDNYQGEALSNLTRGDLVNALYGLIGLRFSAVGNHEFDWGTEHFDRWNVSGVQYLGANIVERKTGQAPSWIKPYAIVQTGGRKVAFIGLSTRETEGTTAPKHLTGLQVEPAAAAAGSLISNRAGMSTASPTPSSCSPMSLLFRILQAASSSAMKYQSSRDSKGSMPSSPGTVTGKSRAVTMASRWSRPPASARRLGCCAWSLKDRDWPGSPLR